MKKIFVAILAFLMLLTFQGSVVSAANKWPTVKTKTFTGVGDDVVLYEIDKPALVTFTCNACTDNTVLKTDGPESLLVNEIGAYSGEHLINTSSNSLTTSFEINANSAWKLVVAGIGTATKVTGTSASGVGAKVLDISAKFRAATIKNVGRSNFVVYSYGPGGRDLVVNVIGSYKGTVLIGTPGLLHIISTGKWQVTFVK